ncbi:hypothetical protein NIES267_54230 [Calothrix parasitica NIES-267]|uniref:DUF6434 domain-containing protein n=1 Tax=Calothrix parasitica NIES-267 TaxID=1973488 RepID=A0A1Z4LXD3_9CYAN|nr:hypothetical protein NIES267_54230 [Calothrix parasitica NIES-267]
MERPKLKNISSAEEFKNWYWLKEELIAYCREVGIKTTGGKFEIAERIVNYLNTGETQINQAQNKSIQKPASNFDWKNEPLTADTVITDNYKNNSNVRQFFLQQVGAKFSFSIDLMQWMKDNVGKTLGDAVVEWHRLQEIKKNPNYQSVIPAHNQYNQYTRDFLADNPDKSIKDARKYWQLKRSIPGNLKYSKSDLLLNDD